MRRFLAAAAGIAISMVSAGHAQTVYPIDRADILVGARFDFKVEFAGLADPTKVSVTLNGKDHAELFGKAATFVEREDGKDQSALILRDASLAPPGVYRLRVSDGANSRELEWNVYDSGPRRAKNVILFIGDGMSLAHRVAARVLAKGIAEGKARGKLAIDDMPHMALVATAGSDSIITDSANSASAYATGHKSAVNAMGVYADRTVDPLDDPKVETMDRLRRRASAEIPGHALFVCDDPALRRPGLHQGSRACCPRARPQGHFHSFQPQGPLSGRRRGAPVLGTGAGARRAGDDPSAASRLRRGADERLSSRVQHRTAVRSLPGIGAADRARHPGGLSARDDRGFARRRGHLRDHQPDGLCLRVAGGGVLPRLLRADEDQTCAEPLPQENAPRHGHLQSAGDENGARLDGARARRL